MNNHIYQGVSVSWTDRIIDTERCKLWDTLLTVERGTSMHSIPREGCGQVTPRAYIVFFQDTWLYTITKTTNSQ